MAAPAEPLHVRESKPIWKQHGRRQNDLPMMPAPASAAAASAASPPPLLPAESCTPCDDPTAFVPLVHLDESQFDEEVTVVALRVPAKLCGIFVGLLKPQTQTQVQAQTSAAAAAAAEDASMSAAPAAPASPSPSWLLVRPRLSAVVDGPSKDVKFILLSEALVPSLAEASKLPPQVRAMMTQHESAGVVPCLYTFTLRYEYFTQEHVLQRLLPAGVTVPAGFETIGHIAHLNLSEEQLPWGGVIARVLLDKNPHLRTILTKVGTISSEYRVFDMRVLGGARCCRTEVREHGCVFGFDFSQVYWNSRLGTEHARMIAAFRPRELVVDATCGIGPFIVPAARELGAQKDFLGGQPALYANDLNPASYAALRDNLARNKVDKLVAASNLDARRFLWDVLRTNQIGKTGKAKGQPAAHVLMNLPAIALEFLDAFIGLYAVEKEEAGAAEESIDESALARVLASPSPLVHAYCFSKEVDNPVPDLMARVERALGLDAEAAAELRSQARWVKDLAEQAEKKKSKATTAAVTADKPAAAASAVAAASAASAVPASSSAAGPALIPSSSLPGEGEVHVRFVRNVAPNKDMYCVSFRVPKAVLTKTPSWRTQQKSAARDQQQAAAAAAAPGDKRKLLDSEEQQPPKRSKDEADDA